MALSTVSRSKLISKLTKQMQIFIYLPLSAKMCLHMHGFLWVLNFQQVRVMGLVFSKRNWCQQFASTTFPVFCIKIQHISSLKPAFQDQSSDKERNKWKVKAGAVTSESPGRSLLTSKAPRRLMPVSVVT